MEGFRYNCNFNEILIIKRHSYFIFYCYLLNKEKDPQRGIIPRSIEEIFEFIENSSDEKV